MAIMPLGNEREMKMINDLAKGTPVKITGNEIFKCMGYEKVTGTFFCYNGDNSGFSFQCEQTRAIECCDFNEGVIEFETSEGLKRLDCGYGGSPVAETIKKHSIELTEKDFEKLGDSKYTLLSMLADKLGYFDMMRLTTDERFGFYDESEPDNMAFWLVLDKICKPDNEGDFKSNDYNEVQKTLSAAMDKLEFENIKFSFDSCTAEFLDQFYPKLTFTNLENDIKAIERDIKKIVAVLDTVEVIKPRTWAIRVGVA